MLNYLVIDLLQKIVLMNRYQFDVRRIEKLLLENEQRKNNLRQKNSNKLVAFLIIIIFIYISHSIKISS